MPAPVICNSPSGPCCSFLTHARPLHCPALPSPALLQTGEWQLPLPEDKLEAMRAVMRSQPGGMDESLLSACYSWMRKAAEDKMDGE